MGGNTPKKTDDPELRDWDLFDVDIEGTVLGDLPEMESVPGGIRLQSFLLPVLALVVILIPSVVFGFITLRSIPVSIDRDIPFSSIESPILRAAIQDINAKRLELELKDIRIRRYRERLFELDELLEEQLNSQNSDFSGIAAFERRIGELRSEREEIELELTQAVEERQILARTIDGDEEEILARLYEESDFVDIVNAGIDADLEILRESRQAENFWLNELANQYLGLLDAISVRDQGRASLHLSALEELFSDSTRADLPGIRARNQADREIIRFFEAYLTGGDDPGIDTMITETRLLAEQASFHLAGGRLDEARDSWNRIGFLRPEMLTVMNGFMETETGLTARELENFANLAATMLERGNYDQANSIWNEALRSLPSPLSDVIGDFWNLWSRAGEARIESNQDVYLGALVQEKAASTEIMNRQMEALEAKVVLLSDLADAERFRLEKRIGELSESLETSRAAETSLREENEQLKEALRMQATAVRDMVARSELNAALARIAQLESPGVRAVQWRLYGVVIRVTGDSLVVEPLTDRIPEKDTEVRVRRSSGSDTVIELTTGRIVEADAARAVVRLLTASEGAEIYGTPKPDDLIYILSP